MKKILLISALLSAFAFANAAVDTRSFRVNGDIVSIGDSVGALMSRAGRPMHQHSYTVDTGRNTTITVTDYIYQVDNEIYTVTVREGRVTKITWTSR